jgi:hypothetical protein
MVTNNGAGTSAATPEAESLSELLADAGAIPRAAFGGSRHARRDPGSRPLHPGTGARVTIPDSTVSMVAAADHEWPDYRR